MFKVIFLDIDGVLATMDTYFEAFDKYAHREFNDETDKLYNQTLISEECIQSLNKIITETDAKVVISSAWRYGKTPEYFQELFNTRGFIGEVIALTPRWHEYKEDIGVKFIKDLEMFWEHERGNEINMWVNRNKNEIKSFIIIDDESYDIEPVFPDQLLVTSMEGGLTDEHINEAITILETPYDDSENKKIKN